jgi:hypothetical protein
MPKLFHGVLHFTSAEIAALGGGTLWLQGTGVPSSGLGSNGNYYIDTTAFELYYKSGGVWASLGVMGGGGGMGATDKGVAQIFEKSIDFYANANTAINFCTANVGDVILESITVFSANDLTDDGSYNGFYLYDNAANMLIPSIDGAKANFPSGGQFAWEGSHIIISGQVLSIYIDGTTTANPTTMVFKVKYRACADGAILV